MCGSVTAKKRPRLPRFPIQLYSGHIYTTVEVHESSHFNLNDRAYSQCIRMPSSATGGDLFRESFGRSLSPEHTEPEERHPGRAGGTALSGEGRGGDAGRPFANRSGPKLWSVVALSALGSAAAVAAVGCVCALIYPILRGKRACARTRVSRRGVCVVFTWN